MSEPHDPYADVLPSAETDGPQEPVDDDSIGQGCDDDPDPEEDE